MKPKAGTRYSDILTGKQSASNPVGYQEAIKRSAFEAMKQTAMLNVEWVDELIYQLSFMYNVRKEKVENDLYQFVEKEYAKLQKRVEAKLGPLPR